MSTEAVEVLISSMDMVVCQLTILSCIFCYIIPCTLKHQKLQFCRIWKSSTEKHPCTMQVCPPLAKVVQDLAIHRRADDADI